MHLARLHFALSPALLPRAALSLAPYEAALLATILRLAPPKSRFFFFLFCVLFFAFFRISAARDWVFRPRAADFLLVCYLISSRRFLDVRPSLFVTLHEFVSSLIQAGHVRKLFLFSLAIDRTGRDYDLMRALESRD